MGAGKAISGCQDAARWPVFHGFSPSVVPRPADWRDDLEVVGYWWPTRTAGWRQLLLPAAAADMRALPFRPAAPPTGEVTRPLRIDASKQGACGPLAARDQTAMLAFWPSRAGAVTSSNQTPPSAR